MAGALVILGIGAVVIAIVGNEFGVTDLEGNSLGRKSSRGSGKLVFFVAGVLFVIAGLTHLLVP